MINRRSFLQRSTISLAAGSMLNPLIGGSRSSTKPEKEWRHYGGDLGSSRYSPLDQINRTNARQLRIAWTYHTGDSRRPTRRFPRTTMECTPIVAGGIMYVTSPLLKVIALEAATGKEIWRFDPFSNAEYENSDAESVHGVNRGVAYWEGGGERRILCTAASNLISLDARTGKPCRDFGKNGYVDLTQGLGRDITGLLYDVTSPGVVYKNLLILGSEVGEGPDPAAPGHIRAFDIRSGKQVWIFHTIPEPGEFGHDTWEGESWRNAGGANDWGGLSVDAKRGWLFAATGSAAFDFYGGQRPGQNLFSNCLLALDASTGRRIWHYQVVHHDLWDRDLPSLPILCTVNHEGRRVEAVAQLTKFSRVFLFDRETGKPLFPVEERPVPASDVPGERAWPTQPYPLKPPPYTRMEFTEDQITDISPEAHAYCLEIYKKARAGKTFEPPSEQGTVVFPGFDGGTDWGGGSFDPETGLLYVNVNAEPWILTLVPTKPGAPYPYGITGYNRFVDQEDYPAIKPPWGELVAIDLNQGEIAWRVRLGEYKALKDRGNPQTGTYSIGGSLVTKGGLIFIGATKDEMFRAFDKSNGNVLFESPLPAGGYASPATYEVDRKQYVVIAAGGGGKPRTKSGDAYVAFALP